MKNIAIISILGPILWAISDILGGLPISPGQNSPILKFFEQFPTQNPNSKGGRSKKIANSCIWGPILRAVLKNQGSANRPRMDRFENFQHYQTQNQNLKGSVHFMKKLPTHVFWALQCRSFWKNGGVSQSAHIGPSLTFYHIFLYKTKVQRRVYFYEKIAISCN